MNHRTRIPSALALIVFSDVSLAHPGPPHTHAFGDEFLHLLPVIALIVAVIWTIRRRSR